MSKLLAFAGGVLIPKIFADILEDFKALTGKADALIETMKEETDESSTDV